MQTHSSIWRTTLLAISFMAISACSQMPLKKTEVTKPVSSISGQQNGWKKRQLILAKKPKWGLTSKIALRYRDDHWTFGLNWAQQALRQYVMQINNPVTGAVVARLTRNNNGVSLLSDDGRMHQDTDEERLLLRQSGVRLPLKGMQYWVRGLSSPVYKIDKLTLDSFGRPQTLYQAGWKIDYSRYLNNSVQAMPGKVVISRDKDSVYLKMIAKQWQGI